MTECIAYNECAKLKDNTIITMKICNQRRSDVVPTQHSTSICSGTITTYHAKSDIKYTKLHLLGLSGTRTKCWLVKVLPSGCLGWRGRRASMYAHRRWISICEQRNTLQHYLVYTNTPFEQPFSKSTVARFCRSVTLSETQQTVLTQ